MKRTLMQKSVFLGLALMFAASPAAAIVLPVESTFDSDAEGWTGNGDFAAVGGNPGGYMNYPGNFQIPAPSDIFAPSEFLGDWSALDGTAKIEFDHRIFDVGGECPSSSPMR